MAEESWEDQMRRNHEKWKKWKMEIKMRNSNIDEGQLVIGKPEDNAKDYALKIIQMLEQPEVKCPISRTTANQFETNTCAICLQIMAPPNNPYILFPCGHNMCKGCLLESKKKRRKDEDEHCPMCRQKITNSAENINLMKLICSYIKNKQKLEQIFQSEQRSREEQDAIQKLTQHCKLLEHEKKILQGDLVELKKSRRVMEDVIDRLLDERRKCRKGLDALEDEARLINRHLNDKEEELQGIESQIGTLEDRRSILDETLNPLRAQKEKMEMVAAEKLIKRGF